MRPPQAANDRAAMLHGDDFVTTSRFLCLLSVNIATLQVTAKPDLSGNRHATTHEAIGHARRSVHICVLHIALPE
jgi:hypothetical protein